MTAAAALGDAPRRPLPTGTSRMGLWVLLASLAALFIATIFCGWYFRDTGAHGARPLPDLPSGLLWTSLLLVGLGRSAQRGALRSSLLFGLVFLAGQALCWAQLLQAETGEGVHPMYAFNFYLMTVLHALHVVGGISYNLRALAAVKVGGRVLEERTRNNATYWHFLAAVWVVILLNLFAIRVPDPQSSFLGPLSLAVSGGLLLAFLVYQLRLVLILWKRGERAFAFFSLLPPVAFMHVWARGEELRTQRMALHWAIVAGLLLLSLIFTGTIPLGRFASDYERIIY
jgi:cytochrome c oxidase subunit 3